MMVFYSLQAHPPPLFFPIISSKVSQKSQINSFKKGEGREQMVTSLNRVLLEKNKV